MDSKERLAELIAGMTEAQTAPLLGIAQTYLTAMKEAEEKGRTDISSEVIHYLSKAAPQAAREPAAPRDAAARNGPAWSAYPQQSAQAAAPVQATPAQATPAQPAPGPYTPR